mmetsp:Transcript_92256/g.214304  ORF Transcript_92256/g.214304 Transcript_92256/m.214304 type:complete len:406 (+) Transcript_92256:31-1248(+)
MRALRRFPGCRPAAQVALPVCVPGAAALVLGAQTSLRGVTCDESAAAGFATLAANFKFCARAHVGKLAGIHEAEARLLAQMPDTPYETWDVPVELDVGRRCFLVPVEREYTIHTVAVGLQHRDKLPVVLVHGFMMGSATFFKWLPLLAQERTVYAIDIIGMAGSGRPPFDASRLSAEEAEELLVDAFERWAEAQGLKSFALVGHSFGGYVCAAWACRHPERIRYLGLLSPLLGFSDERISRFEPREDAPWQQRAVKCLLDAAWAHHITPQSLVRWIPGAKGMFERASQHRFQSFASNVTVEEGQLLSEYVVATMDTPSSTEQAPLVCFGPLLRPLEVNGGTIKARLAQLSVPMFVLYGDHDWMDKAQPAEVPNCEFIQLPRSGHHLYLDNPVELATQVLARLPAQ